MLHRAMRTVMTAMATVSIGAAIGIATSVPEPPLEELVLDSDHILAGTVRLVDMVDRDGNQVTDPGAMTGPGRSNTIRLHVVVDSDGVILTNAPSVPKEVIIPLWTAWHYSLHDVKQAEGSRGVSAERGDVRTCGSAVLPSTNIATSDHRADCNSTR